MEELISPVSVAEAAAGGATTSLFVRTNHMAEHDFLQAQALHTFASALLSDAGSRGERRQVPVFLSMTKLAELMLDEQKRTNARDMILTSFAANYPKKSNSDAGDVLKQAMELRALVIVADVRTEVDVHALKSEAVLEELLAQRLLLVATEEVIGKVEAELPSILFERCRMLEVHTWGCFMNDALLSNGAAKQLLLKMRPTADRDGHYERISALHLGSAQIDKDTQQELCNLLTRKECILRTLDVSNTQIDGNALVQALSRNSSLRSLDVRLVTAMTDVYESLGDMLLAPDATCRLSYLRCDAFDVHEGESALSLRERPLAQGAMRLLTGLLRHNRDVADLDLVATGMLPEWATMLIQTLGANPATTSVKSVQLTFNPAIDESAQAALVAAVEARELKVELKF